MATNSWQQHIEHVRAKGLLVKPLYVILTEPVAGLEALVLDNEAVLLRQGDFCVERGTNPAWANRWGKPCDHLAVLFAHMTDARSYCDGKPDVAMSTALRNSSLQGGYLILAAPLPGLDCAPMSGFDAEKMDRAFRAGSSVRTHVLCALGHGDHGALRQRPPRLQFKQACSVV